MGNTPRQVVQLDISVSTLIKLSLFALSLYILSRSFSIFLLLYIAVILASALRPILNAARYMKIPRTIAIMIVYLSSIAAIVGLVSLVIPPIASQTNDFVRNIPTLAEQLANRYTWIKDAIQKYEVRDYLVAFSNTFAGWSSKFSQDLLSNAWSITSGVFGGLISVFLVLVLTFYLLVEERSLVHTISSFFPDHMHTNVTNLINAIQSKLGAWMRGQISLCLIVGILTYIGYTILGVKYAIPLAVMAGLLEIVPIIGPNIAGIVAVLVVLPSSLILAVGVAIIAFVIQQIENTIIVPMVMKQAVGLDPILVIISLSIGGTMIGPIGTILAVPLVASVQILFQFYQAYKKENHLVLEPDGSLTSTSKDMPHFKNMLKKFHIPFSISKK